MDALLRTTLTYFFLLVVFRLAGKRSLAQITTFDFVLLLIVGEATQQALLGEDFSIINAVIVIVTLIGLDVGLSLWKRHSRTLGRLLDSTPLIVVEDGKPLSERMEKSRIDESDVLESARRLQGLERMEQIQYAVLERDGSISIIPKEEAK